MAVKAKAEITLATIRDVQSVTRYYLLQSSTSSIGKLGKDRTLLYVREHQQLVSHRPYGVHGRFFFLQ